MSCRRINEDAPSHTRQTLVESLSISAVHFRCLAGVEPEGLEEPNPTNSIVFVRRGVFRRTHRDETLLADPNHILFFNASQPYRYSHPIPGGDDCTILAIATTAALELVAQHAPRDAERTETPFRLDYGLCSAHVARLHYEFLALVHRAAPIVAVEDALSELAQEGLRAAYETHGTLRKTKPLCFGARRRQRDLCEAVKVTVNKRIDSLPSLGELAQSLDCSPFHLSRTFHQMTGMSLRRYIIRLRTSMAAERLANGAKDLTDLALDLGFADHSHFTNTFRKEWGIPPSRLRARLSLNGALWEKSQKT
jgi:AraC family transcriptional regulator